MKTEETTIAVVGGGPVGLVLACRVHDAGIPVVVLDSRDGTEWEDHGRAGLWEHRTVETLTKYGLAAGLLAHGQRHPAFELRFFGKSRMVNYGQWLGGGIAHYAYPQHRLERDLRAAFSAANGDLRTGATVTDITGLADDNIVIGYQHANGRARSLRCAAVVGADGSHGRSQEFAPPGAFTRHRGEHPAAGLAIFAETPSPVNGIIYATSEHGFGAQSIRNATVSRLFVRCAPTDSPDDWPADRIWAALDKSMAVDGGPHPPVPHGRILSRTVVPMRTQVTEPLGYRSLYLTGDAGHTITPLGAKGANLGVADAADLAESLIACYLKNDDEPLRSYSQRRLADVWQAQAFSRQLLELWMPPPGEDPVSLRVRRSRLEELLAGGPLTEWFAHRYAGIDPGQTIPIPITHRVPEFGDRR